VSEFDDTQAFFDDHPDGTVEEAAQAVYGRGDVFSMRYVQLNAEVLGLPQAPRLTAELDEALAARAARGERGRAR
jgi:hypothetical protein